MLEVEEKRIFDHLNQTSYMLRLQLERNGLELVSATILDHKAWHVLYNDFVVGTVTFKEDDGFTYCNIRLYKYLKQKLKNDEDFIMSEYYDMDGDIRTHFRFKKFDKYFDAIKNVIDKDPGAQSDFECTRCPVEDSVLRLTEYCDEYDAKFSKNIFVRDIMNIISENAALHEELKTRSDTVFKAFLRH